MTKGTRRNGTLKKRIFALTMFLGASLILAGCEGQSSSRDYAMNESAPAYAMATTSSAKYDAGGYSAAMDSYDWDMEEEVYEDDVYEEAYYEDGSYDKTTSQRKETSIGAGEGQEAASLQQEKLVYTGSLTVETTAFNETLARIKKTIQEMGGFIESESDNDNSYGWYREDYRKTSNTLSSSLQARIPSGRFQEFLDGIEGDGAKVTSRYVNVENISRRYSETALSIESYEIQERRLLEMMEGATRVSDMLEIEARLSEVQNSLKQLKNSLSSMDTDVAYSTVSIYLSEVGIYSQPKATTFGEKVGEAFSDALDSFVEGVQLFALWLVRNFLNIIVTILVIIVALWILRKLLAKALKKRAMKKDDLKPEDVGKVKE